MANYIRNETGQNHSVSKIHSLRNSFAVPFGLCSNKFLFDSKKNADNHREKQ